MKKILLVAILLLYACFTQAQNFSVGLVTGLSSTDVSGIDALDGDEDFYRVGVVLGGFVNRSFNDRISVQMELLYATKGSLQPADSSNNFYFFKLRLDYLEVPILFKYKMHLIVNKEALDKLEIEGGPSFATLINSWQADNYGDIPFDREYNKTDFLFNVGLNYYFSENVSLDVRFANSIVPVRKNPNNAIYGMDKGQFNTTFSYTFRFIFR